MALEKKIIDRLSRVVEVVDNGVYISTESLPGIKYAFYLRNKEGVVKKGYISENSAFFNILPSPGIYKATFFYKAGVEKLSITHEFYLNDSYKFCSLDGVVVDEGLGWRIDYYNVESKTTFLVFNSTGSTKKAKPFGFEFLIKNGFNVVHCLQDNNQYQLLSFEKIREVVTPLVFSKNVFLYGSSLGGYCAMYYAGAVNGTAIAAAPRNSAHPVLIEKANGVSRYKSEEFQHKNIWDNPLSTFRPYVFYDPHVEIDNFFVNSYLRNAYPDLHDLACEFAGHPVLMHLNRTNQLSGVVRSIVAGQRFFIDDSRESCYTDFGRAKKAIRDGDYKSAKYILRKLLKSPDENDNKILEKSGLLYEELLKL